MRPPIPSRPVTPPAAPGRCPARRRPSAPSGRAGEADAHRVDKAVALVGWLEVDLPPNRRDPDRVAVVADSLDHPLEEVLRSRRGELAEAQRVEQRDRPRSQREDVAQDASHSGGGSLERLYGARMVVRFDLEGDGVPLADVDRAGVLAGPHQNPRPLGREPSQSFRECL